MAENAVIKSKCQGGDIVEGQSDPRAMRYRTFSLGTYISV